MPSAAEPLVVTSASAAAAAADASLSAITTTAAATITAAPAPVSAISAFQAVGGSPDTAGTPAITTSAAAAVAAATAAPAGNVHTLALTPPLLLPRGVPDVAATLSDSLLASLLEPREAQLMRAVGDDLVALGPAILSGFVAGTLVMLCCCCWWMTAVNRQER
jgi:hypothetical protein